MPRGRVADFGAYDRAREAWWDDPARTDAEHAAMRAEYVADGWKVCDHEACPPWSCRVESGRS